MMTGKEAWDLISPHINPMEHEQFNTKEMAEAFVTVYIALKEMDQRDSQNKLADH